MSRALQTVAPVLKALLVVVIIAAWVEANAKRVSDPVPPPAQSLSKASPPSRFDPFRRVETPQRADRAPDAGECSPKVDRRNVQRIAPARAPVVET